MIDSKKNKIYASVLATILSCSLLSGCKKNDDNAINIDNQPRIKYVDNLDNNTSILREDDVIEIADYFRQFILENDDGGEITVEDLNKIVSLNFSVPVNFTAADLRWLNYCVNLERMYIVIENDDVLKDVYNLPSLHELEVVKGFIHEEDNNLFFATLEKENCSFIENARNLETLKIRNFNIEKGFLESLTSLKKLYLVTECDEIAINYDIDYSKLTYLDDLIITRPYSIIIHMDKDEVTKLLENNVRILLQDQYGYIDISEFMLKTSLQLDSIARSINIDATASDMEKFKAILSYVLNNLEYDAYIKEQLNNDSLDIDVARFYALGYLYGALNRDSAICGNYSALLSALADRVGLDSLFVASMTHAWNLVYIDGTSYYVDATSLDNSYLGNDNNSDKIVIQSFDINNDVYNYINLPEEIIVSNNKQIKLIDYKNYKIMIGEKILLVSDIVLLGIFIYLYRDRLVNKKYNKSDTKKLRKTK